MQLHGGVNLMGNTTTKAVLGDGSQSGTSLNMENEIDPLEEEEPIVPMMRREGRREAVSAAPLSMASLQSFQSSLRAEKSPAEARQLLRLIRNSHLFSRMEDTELDGIVRAMAKEEYQGGEDILVQGGEPKEKLFVLAEGACEVIKNGRSVATVHVGATFGELEMMYKQATNAATVRCVANCVTYTLDEVNYHRAVMNDSLQKRKRYVEVVQNVPFLKCLPEYERLKIAEALLCKSYKRGQTIIKFGQKGDLMHCIMKGTVKVVGRNNGKKVEVVRLGENDVVGELEFLFGHLTVADVIATSRRVVTACITRKHFELIAGPIQDRLKEFVATSPTYENYYINEVADMSVRSELSKMGSSRRSKRIASKGSDGVDKVAFGDIEAGGELVMTVPQGLSEFVAEMSSIGDTAEDSGTVAPSKTQKKKPTIRFRRYFATR
ncbi:protein kinase A regulatory subunit [Angomonas deanei]|uniref:Cyclic nucleotide-binding domain containing protein, putative n=1 Tax=Angomonas deanei TaxID=59799 RepID=A0A7G2CRZ8_9TRYP|nr:protein kinase A regulatory subunit [Angomonas deanei]CAD2221947.1 Cyclic nucleotide-binding domain containing protein, putative [Angomonas deanei]|eukprot:EPY21356.1 protein kinase A regulatory subunit [Angomonas deanei]